jgi:dTDP-4-dehydrorhamnose reductase
VQQDKIEPIGAQFASQGILDIPGKTLYRGIPFSLVFALSHDYISARMNARPEHTVWITGAGGLIGSYLVRTAPLAVPAWRIRGLTRADFDLLDSRTVREAFRRDNPSMLVHCAALANSPACQKQPALARRLNVEMTAFLANLAADIPFVFFSTDLVFDGRRGHYDETASVNPLGVYAETKVTAERIVREHPRHTIIRTSLNGGTSPKGDRGFNEEMRLAWQRGESLRLFTDEFRNPIPAVVTAQATWALVARGAMGLYHVAGAERLSRWELGRLIAARWPQLNPRIEAASLAEYRGAPRAPDTTLCCAKAQALLSFPLPKLSAWLTAHPDEEF